MGSLGGVGMGKDESRGLVGLCVVDVVAFSVS